jgi:glycine/D-amino acid oxidase-like deaminating enzyme
VNGKCAIVVGGGFVGAACAWRLARDGWRTEIVDTGDETLAASWGNAGHLAIEQTAPLASLATLRSLPRRLVAFGGPVGLHIRDAATWLPFGLRLVAASAPARFQRAAIALKSLLALAMPAWHRLVAETGSARLVRTDGHYVAWESASTHATGRMVWLKADLGCASVRDASSEELGQLRKLFADRPVGAVRFLNTGQVLDIPALRAGLSAALRSAGGTLRAARVAAVEVGDNRAAVRLTDGTRLDADIVVIAAGIGSAELLRPYEGPIPLIAERGYHVEATSELDNWPAAHPPVAFEDRSVIVTRFARSLRLAGFTEFADRSAPPDIGKWHRLDRHADALGLPKSGHRARWMGARPTLPDYLPAIGRSRSAANLLYAFGHQHLGVTLAAATGEIIAAIARGGTPDVPMTPFDIRRFR